MLRYFFVIGNGVEEAPYSSLARLAAKKNATIVARKAWRQTLSTERPHRQKTGHR